MAVKLRSKLRDFGDKDDRSERPKDTEKEIFGYDSSDDVSQHRRLVSKVLLHEFYIYLSI